MSDYDKEFQKVQEVLPNAEQDIPRLRRHLKSKGMSDDDLNGVNSADEVLSYYNQMTEEQSQRTERLNAAANRAKAKKDYDKIINNEKLSPNARISALLDKAWSK